MRHYLTPARGAAIYEMLCQLPPFHRWKLPPKEELKFVITRDIRHRAQFGTGETSYVIWISERSQNHLAPLVETIAHEMVHLFQRIRKLETRAQHNADFTRRWKSICGKYGWDWKLTA